MFVYIKDHHAYKGSRNMIEVLPYYALCIELTQAEVKCLKYNAVRCLSDSGQS